MLAHEWANPEATKRSFELVAQRVMSAFQGQAQSTLDARARAIAKHTEYSEQQLKAVAHMTEKYAAEKN